MNPSPKMDDDSASRQVTPPAPTDSGLREEPSFLDKNLALARLGRVTPQPDAFENLERLYADHAEALFQFLLSLSRSEADTKDLLQEIFLRLARKPPPLGSIQNVRAWLLTIAYRLFIDTTRRRSTYAGALDRLALEPSPIFQPTSKSDADIFRLAVEKALAILPTEQRSVVHLKLWEELTFAEIADVLGIPPNTAASRYRYGLDKLRAELRPLHGEML